MSKGSGRRPQDIPEDEAQANWERVFGKKDPAPAEEPNGPEPTIKER